MIAEWVTAGLIVSGAAFALIAAIGVIRLPDVFIRMHATTKAGTLGCGLILVGLAVQSGGDTGVLARAAAAIVFLFMTAPVAAHMIGRAAYRTGAPLASSTHVDELAGTEAAMQDAGDARPAKQADDKDA